MFPQKSPIPVAVESKTYPLGETSEPGEYGYALALIALSHTPVEHRLYSAMLAVPGEAQNGLTFTARGLMTMTGIRSLSTIRRGLEGLLVKLSIERRAKEKRDGKREQGSSYRAYRPAEIIARRKQIGGTRLGGYGLAIEDGIGHRAFDRAIARVADNGMLSRREAQVALCCVEGFTNAEIGKRLGVTEQTVKFHLRHIFVKFGVKRRAELISKLLM
jgi:DNA-binding CsgD family transcriptional regulator